MGFKNGVATTHDGNQSKLVSRVAGNSLDASSGTFISMSGGFAVASNTVLPIAGVSVTEKIFTSNNQTVARDEVTFLPSDSRTLYRIQTSAAIAQADVGRFYNLTAAQIVDQATGATATIANGQIRLESITDSTTQGIFSIILR